MRAQWLRPRGRTPATRRGTARSARVARAQPGDRESLAGRQADIEPGLVLPRWGSCAPSRTATIVGSVSRESATPATMSHESGRGLCPIEQGHLRDRSAARSSISPSWLTPAGRTASDPAQRRPLRRRSCRKTGGHSYEICVADEWDRRVRVLDARSPRIGTRERSAVPSCRRNCAAPWRSGASPPSRRPCAGAARGDRRWRNRRPAFPG